MDKGRRGEKGRSRDKRDGRQGSGIRESGEE